MALSKTHHSEPTQHYTDILKFSTPHSKIWEMLVSFRIKLGNIEVSLDNLDIRIGYAIQDRILPFQEVRSDSV